MELSTVAASTNVGVEVESDRLQHSLTGNSEDNFKVALKDFLNLVQSLKEDNRIQRKPEETGKSGYHIIWKELLEGQEEAVNDWLRDCKTNSLNIDEVDCNGLNALHYAILFRQPLLVKLLVEAGAGLTTPATSLHFLPLHLAVIGPHPFTEAVDLLCPKEESIPMNEEEEEDTCYSFYSKKDVVNFCNPNSLVGTALDLALYIRSEEAVKVLVEKGADIGHCWEGRTCLEKAIEIREKNIVSIMLRIEEDVINVDALKRVKECRSEFLSEKHGHIPFNDLISAYPDFAEKVMDTCISTKHSPHEQDYEIIFDCSLFENERSFINKCYRGLPCTCCCDMFGIAAKNHRSNDSGSCVNFNRKFYDSFEKEQHPLYHVKESDDYELLKHPLVQALLKVKLSPFFWMLYFFNFSIYLALVSFLVIFILYIPNPRTTECLKITNSSSVDMVHDCSAFLSTTRSRVLLAFKILTLILILVRALCEVYQFYHQKILNYIFSWENWLEIAQCLSTTVFLFRVDSDDCFCSTRFEWQAGIVSLALSCLVFILWTETIPLIGIYVIIMKKIVNSFIKIALFGILLIVGFGLSFYMMFYRPPNEGVNSGTYSNPLRAILAVIPLTAGDISIDSVFYSDGQSFGSEYETLAFVIWLSSIIIMSILFNNLLVGLAVGEVRDVLDEARKTEIQKKIDLVLTLEENLPERIHMKIIQTKPIVTKPNVSKVISFFKGILVTCCFGFSLVCFNLNHMRFWYWFGFQPPKQKSYVKAVASIMEKNRLYRLEKKTMDKDVTRGEVQLMMEDLKNELVL